MQKFIPFGKLSKKKQREQHKARRGSWRGLNPVTRKPESPKAYNRKKARKWEDDSPMTASFIHSRHCALPAFKGFPRYTWRLDQANSSWRRLRHPR